jgi:hypothetical protein
LFPLFATSVIDTGGKFAAGDVDTVWQIATGVIDPGSKFAAGIVDTGGKFATGINNTRENGGKICRPCSWYRLPPVSTTLGKMVAKFAAGVVDTGGKFATGVVDTCGAPWLANISANFRNNSKRSKCDTLGLGGNWFMKKTGSKKSRDTVPLSCASTWAPPQSAASRCDLARNLQPLRRMLAELVVEACRQVEAPAHAAPGLGGWGGTLLSALLMGLQNPPLELHVVPTTPRVDGSAMPGLRHGHEGNFWFASVRAQPPRYYEGGRQLASNAYVHML